MRCKEALRKLAMDGAASLNLGPEFREEVPKLLSAGPVGVVRCTVLRLMLASVRRTQLVL